MPVAQRLHRRLDDMLGRAEVRLADAEIDDVAALRRELIGAREHGEGVLFADAVEGGDGVQAHAGKRAFYVGMDEVVALIEERRTEMLGDGVGEAIAEVKTGGMSAACSVALGGLGGQRGNVAVDRGRSADLEVRPAIARFAPRPSLRSDMNLDEAGCRQPDGRHACNCLEGTQASGLALAVSQTSAEVSTTITRQFLSSYIGAQDA